MKQDIDEIVYKLNECENVKEMFNVLESYYDLKNTKIGPIIKPVFVQGLVKAIKLIKPVNK
jgi:hypothetical protein